MSTNKNPNTNMSFSEHCNQVFNQAIRDYHIKDNIDTPFINP